MTRGIENREKTGRKPGAPGFYGFPPYGKPGVGAPGSWPPSGEPSETGRKTCINQKRTNRLSKPGPQPIGPIILRILAEAEARLPSSPRATTDA